MHRFNVRRLFALAAFAAAAGAGAGSAQAQAQINQDNALAGNVTPGDTAGFPITISQPGSYKLTSNLYPGDKAAIVVSADNVTIDLNGFSIQGPGTCKMSSYVVTCSGTSMPNVNGIELYSTKTGMTVRNGTIQGFSGNGVRAFTGVVIDGVRLAMNAKAGASIYGSDPGAHTRVVNVRAELNGVAGLQASSGTIQSTQAVRNGGAGIDAGGMYSLVTDSVAAFNGGVGIQNAMVRSTLSNTNKGGDVANVESLGGNAKGGTVY